MSGKADRPMTDDEIEEKLRSLSPTQLSDLLGKLFGGDALTNKQRQELLELQTTLNEEAKRRNEVAKNLLREKGPQILELIHQSLRDDSLTTEQRRELVWCRRSSLHKSFVIPASKAEPVLACRGSRESFLENDSGQAGMTRLIKFISGTPH
jgi:hypothetical protein